MLARMLAIGIALIFIGASAPATFAGDTGGIKGRGSSRRRARRSKLMGSPRLKTSEEKETRAIRAERIDLRAFGSTV
jgi:hypothetical protein